MPHIAYVDSSAVLKLVVSEAETATLTAYLAARDALVASRLAVLECRRAVRRTSKKRVLQAVEDVFEAIYLLELSPAILDRAAAVDPPLLRSLDAIHLATAQSIGDPDLEIVTYDRRLAEAAVASGLRAVQPGR